MLCLSMLWLVMLWSLVHRKKGPLYPQYRIPLLVLHRSCNPSGQGFIATPYRVLVEDGKDDELGVTLGFGYIVLESLFLRTFDLSTMDNFQKALTWRCYREALPVRDMFARHGQLTSSTNPRCGLERELGCVRG